MTTKIFALGASICFMATCLWPTDPEPEAIEEPCFIADTVGRSAEFNTDLPCWLWIVDCRVEQICVSRIEPARSQ